MNKLEQLRNNLITTLSVIEYSSRWCQFDNEKYNISLKECYRQYKEEIVDNVIFKLIKEEFIKNSSYSNSLFNHADTMTNNGYSLESVHKQYVRVMKMSNYYKRNLDNQIKTDLNLTESVIQIKDMKDLKTRFKGYKLSDYELAMLDAMNNLKLFKIITNRKIVSVKSVPNSSLNNLFKEYRDYFISIRDNKLIDDHSYILYSLLLFTTEMSYHIESVYRIASKLKDYNNSRSNNKFPDDYIQETKKLNTIFTFKEKKYIKESDLVLN